MNGISTQSAPGTYALASIIQGYNRSMASSLEKLSTGLRVNSPSDDIISYFRSRQLSKLADSTATVASGLQEHVSLLETAQDALTTISDIMDKMKDLAKEASTEDNAVTRKDLGKQYDDLKDSITTIVNTTRYDGQLILNGNLDVNAIVTDSSGKARSAQVGEDVNDTYSYEVLDTRVLRDGVNGTNKYNGLNLEDDDMESQWFADKTEASNSYKELTEQDSGQIRLRRNLSKIDTELMVLNGARTNMENKQSNYEAASSALAGVDEAEETSHYTSLQIHQQAAASFLAQSNIGYGNVISLLTGTAD